MGYTTDFEGSFSLSRPATEKEKDYINLFGDTRRMKRDVNKLMELFKGEHGYPFAKDNTPEAIYGNEGEYFAREDGESGQYHDKSIIDFNLAPGQETFGRHSTNGQPGLWCQWRLNDDGTELEWDDSEKFYSYVEWLQYLITHFFEPWGIKLNGEVEYQGEESGDFGKIISTDNKVTVKIGRKEYD
jgi:hypothetical protein